MTAATPLVPPPRWQPGCACPEPDGHIGHARLRFRWAEVEGRLSRNGRDRDGAGAAGARRVQRRPPRAGAHRAEPAGRAASDHHPPARAGAHPMGCAGARRGRPLPRRAAALGGRRARPARARAARVGDAVPGGPLRGHQAERAARRARRRRGRLPGAALRARRGQRHHTRRWAAPAARHRRRARAARPRRRRTAGAGARRTAQALHGQDDLRAGRAAPRSGGRPPDGCGDQRRDRSS